MNPYSPIWLDSFVNELSQITKYLIYNASSSVADQLVEAIKTQARKACSNPELYPVFELEPDFRKMPIRNWRYVAFYTVEEQPRQIILTHIYHTSRDIHSIMQGLKEYL